MQIGQKYLAVSPATSFDDVDGSLVEFPEKRFRLEVLPKPDKVMVDDGETSTIESLPSHLKSVDWYLIRNLETGRKHWFNPLNYQITQLNLQH